MISMQRITLHSRGRWNSSRAGLDRFWAERQKGHPEAGAPEWALPGVSAHQMSLHWPKATGSLK